MKSSIERLCGALAGGVTCSALFTLIAVMVGVQDWRLAAWCGLYTGLVLGLAFPRVFIELFVAIFGLIF